MAAPKFRSKLAREVHLAKVGELYLKQIPQYKIAEATGVSSVQITYDLKRLHEIWQKSALTAVGEVKARELAKIDKLEYEYWEGWLRSQQVREISMAKKRTKASTEESEAAMRKEGQVGDPRFLQGVQWCVEQRAQMYGYAMPSKIALTDPTGENEYVGVTNAERMAVLVAIADRARARAVGQGVAGLLADGQEGEGGAKIV